MVVEVAEEVRVDKPPKTTKKKQLDKGMDFLQNMSNSELSMIHRLAGNDVEVRKATIKKLRKWLRAIATKIPDSDDSRGLIDANFGRVWKAMFYCMWMADKPLPQETLAEQIGNFVSIFSDKPHLMMLFVEWFFVTFVREWPWIDRLRLDKFMMLIRRVLRKMLQEFSTRDWEEETLDRFLNILTVHLFNHHPKIEKSRKNRKLPDPPKAPLGFQIHIVNIFLEELAKVGGSALESPKILRLIEPFINEMADNDDQRLLDEIKERLFHHLMKQSDVGIDYVESRGGTLEFVEMEDEDDSDQEADEIDVMEGPKANGALDPRAGQVDVVLPQLDIDYSDLVEMLSEAALRETTKGRNRKILASLARQFENLTKGQFPLGFKREGTRIPAIKRSEIESAAQRLIGMEEEIKGSKVKRKNKKKRQLKTEQTSSALNETISSEDSSLFNESGIGSDNIDENYDSYITETETTHIKDKKTKKPKELSEALEQNDSAQENLLRKIKTARRKSTGSISSKGPTNPDPVPVTKAPEANADKSEDLGFKNNVNGSGNEGETYVTIKRKRRLSEPRNKPQTQDLNNGNKLSKEQISQIYSHLIASTPKRSKLGKSQELGQTPSPKTIGKSVTPTTGPSRLSLVSGGTPLPKTFVATPSSSSVKKKVNFVLDKNLEHPHADYQESILRSPAIPYDGAKRPSFGLLKSRSPATPSPSVRQRLLKRSLGGSGQQGTPRRRASDFFKM